MFINTFLNKFLDISSKNVLILMSGAIFSQLITIVLSPILTRLYTPEEYGILGVYASLVAVFSAIASLKYEAAILLPKNDSNAIQLTKLSSIIIITISVLILIALFFFQETILVLVRTSELKNIIYLASISILTIGFFNVFKNILNRFGSYKKISILNITKSSSTAFSQLGFGFYNFGFKGLILGRVFGDMTTFITGYFFLNKENRFKYAPKDSKKSLSKIAAEYQEFPKITTLHTFFNTVSASLPILILAAFFTSDVVGNFNQSIKITFLPVTLISASTYQVFSRKITETLNTGNEIYPTILETIKKLLIVGVIPFLTLMIFAPWLFEFVFGDEWRVAGVYTQLMVPYIFLVFIVSPLAYLPILRNQQRKAFVIEIIYLVLRVIGLLVGVYFNSVLIAIGLYSLSGFLVQCYNLNWFIKLGKI